MLPSAGFFGQIHCPFFRLKLCKRPHCLYKHVKEERATLDSQYESTVTLAGLKRNPSAGTNGSSVRAEARDTCLLELERINKEIETVKCEVEKEQKRLSQYQTVEVESIGTGLRKVPMYKPESEGKDLNGNRPLVKYVVDNTKPRTDLEYDPLSNFSADLRSGSSVEYKIKPGKEQKVNSQQVVKRVRNTVCAQENLPSSERVESEEEGVLIIDVPPSPDRKRPRGPKLQNALAETEQEVSERVPEGRSVPTVAGLPSPLPTTSQVAVVKPQAVASEAKVSVESAGCLSSFSAYQSNMSEVNVVTVFEDLSRCLDDLRSETDRMVQHQEPSSKAVRTSVAEPDQPEAVFSALMQLDEDAPVSDSEASLMAESSLLDVELSSIDAHSPPFSLPYQVPAEKQSCELHQSYQSSAASYWSPPRNISPPCNQNILQQPPMMDFASVSYPINCMEPAGSTAGVTLCRPCQPLQVPSSSQPCAAAALASPAAPPSGQDPLEPAGLDHVKSSSEEDLNYSDVELSDSDPMEECYRIFMEANKEEKALESASDPQVGSVDAESAEVTAKPKALVAQRKRVAHVSKLPEPVAKSKAQVIIPLRGPSPPAQAPLSKIQLLQQRAAMMTAVLKGGQPFSSSTPSSSSTSSISSSSFISTSSSSSSSSTQKRVLTLVPPHTHSPCNHLTPVQSTCMKVIPLGHAIKVGNSLHFILPEGSYALPSSVSTSGAQMVSQAAQLVSQLVPVTGQMSPVATPVTPVFRSALPATIPITPAQPSSVSRPPAPPQSASCIPARPISSKRKAKLRPEVHIKVPHDVRQRYVNLFVEEFLKTSGTVQEAFEKALAEEKTVYDRSVNKLKYLSVAVNALKRLKNQSTTTAKVEQEARDQLPRGKIPLMVKALKGKADSQLYESLKEHILSDEALTENNYPLQHPEQPGTAVLFSDCKKGATDPLKRICCRCGATYSVGQTGRPSRREECTYHYGKGVEKKVPGGVETRYSCCEGVVGAPGCQVFKLHVHDAMDLDGFVGTRPRPASEDSCPGVYAVDTEMCYTIHGLELVRVTVVNSDLQVIYDTFVKPDHEVIDYNTRFSGVSEGDVADASPSLRDVQETLLGFVSSDAILIGHSLETDLCALKLLHGTVVDTSMVFPHRLGPPHKLSLHSLTTDYLRRIILESEGGHDTAEDATACMELMLWKVREDGKAKRW